MDRYPNSTGCTSDRRDASALGLKIIEKEVCFLRWVPLTHSEPVSPTKSVQSEAVVSQMSCLDDDCFLRGE